MNSIWIHPFFYSKVDSIVPMLDHLWITGVRINLKLFFYHSNDGNNRSYNFKLFNHNLF